MKGKDEIINEAIERLSALTKKDFHGYRSETWDVILNAMRWQDKITRHACAEALSMCHLDVSGQCIWFDEAHARVINVRAL